MVRSCQPLSALRPERRHAGKRRRTAGGLLRQAAALAMAGVTLGLLGADVSTFTSVHSNLELTYLIVELTPADGSPVDEACRWWVLQGSPSAPLELALLSPLAPEGWSLESGCLVADFDIFSGNRGGCHEAP